MPRHSLPFFFRSCLWLAFLTLALSASACAHTGQKSTPKMVTHVTEAVRNVTVKGARKVSASSIRGGLQTRSTPLYPLSRDLRITSLYRTLDREALEDDRKRIENHYKLEGFLSARVRRVEVREVKRGGGKTPPDSPAAGGQPLSSPKETKKKGRTPPPTFYDVVFEVREGKRAIYRSVEVEVVGDAPEAARAAAVVRNKIRVGSAVSYLFYQEVRAQALSSLLENGYARATVEGEIQADAPSRTADLLLRIDPGEKTHFGAVRIRGNRRVPKSIIASQHWLRPGEDTSPTALQRLRADLYDLGVFATVSTRLDMDPKNGNTLPVDVSVKESDPRTVKVSGGVRLEPDRDEIGVSLVVEHRNAFRRAIQLRSRSDLGVGFFGRFLSLDGAAVIGGEELSVSIPHFPARRLSLRATGGAKVDVELGHYVFNPSVSLGIDLTPLRRAVVGLAFHLEHYRFGPQVIQDDNKESYLSRPYSLGYWELRGEGRWGDGVVSALRGFYVRGTVAAAGPATASVWSYLRAKGEVGGYLPLVPKHVSLAARVAVGVLHHPLHLGAITSEGASSSNAMGAQAVTPSLQDTPPSERFFLGGGSDVRGWGRNMLGLRDDASSCDSGNCLDVPLGGDAMFLAQLELRGYLPFGLGGAAFVDVGRVWAVRLGPLSELQVSVGGGIRFRSPVGLLRLDLAVPVIRDPLLARYQPDYAFHFGIGEAF